MLRLMVSCGLVKPGVSIKSGVCGGTKKYITHLDLFANIRVGQIKVRVVCSKLVVIVLLSSGIICPSDFISISFLYKKVKERCLRKPFLNNSKLELTRKVKEEQPL